LPASYAPARVQARRQDLLAAVDRLASSAAIGIATSSPFNWSAPSNVRRPGQPVDVTQVLGTLSISPRFLSVLGIPIIAGRNLLPGDAEPAAILINEAMAALYFPGENPIGSSLLVGPTLEQMTPRHIVGVVRDAFIDGSDLRNRRVFPQTYEPLKMTRTTLPTFVLRDDVAGLEQTVAALGHQLDPHLRLSVESLDAALDRRFGESRFLASLAGILAAVALVFASFGVFGVFAYVVRQRTREIGIRMALGARSRQVVRGVLGAGIRPFVMGLAAGLVGAAGTAQLIRREFHGVLNPFDPLAYLAAVVIVVVAACAAVTVPAWHATRVDPVTALRAE